MAITKAVKKVLSTLASGGKINYQTRDVTLDSTVKQGLIAFNMVGGWYLTELGKTMAVDKTKVVCPVCADGACETKSVECGK